MCVEYESIKSKLRNLLSWCEAGRDKNVWQFLFIFLPSFWTLNADTCSPWTSLYFWTCIIETYLEKPANYSYHQFIFRQTKVSSTQKFYVHATLNILSELLLAMRILMIYIKKCTMSITFDVKEGIKAIGYLQSKCRTMYTIFMTSSRHSFLQTLTIYKWLINWKWVTIKVCSYHTREVLFVVLRWMPHDIPAGQTLSQLPWISFSCNGQ